MDLISGSCSVDKMSGMVYIREDLTPSTLEWKAIEGAKVISFPLNQLVNLQATKDDSPKMILRVIYKLGEEEKAFKLAFTNRPTMNNIKDSLQAIVARSRTVIKDTPAGTPGPQDPASAANGKNANSTATSTPTPSNSLTGLTFSNPESLTDANLLKNLQLQQKLLLEDRELRFVFTQSVMHYKLSPTIFWSTRLNQLRTYALTISQHKGPYNILSAIKPVATSDNQVNVNVTRDTINEIFQTYPIVKRAFDDLVPAKFSEGELWSRFFNSKLFRRLRGDKINNTNNRGDVILDKYLYIDQDFKEDEDKESTGLAGDSIPVHSKDPLDSTSVPEDQEQAPHHVNKFIDLLGNEDDNSQKLGNKPDITMRYQDTARSDRQENEMIILMKNMNKLSSKMVSMSERSNETATPSLKSHVQEPNTNEYTPELDLNDLNELEEIKFIKLNIDTKEAVHMETLVNLDAPVMDAAQISAFLSSNKFGEHEINLNDTFMEKREDINKTTVEMTHVIKQNFKTFKLGTNRESAANNLVPAQLIQEIITYNMSIVEFLVHFWGLFQGGQNLVQLKKIYTSLKNYQRELGIFKEKAIESFSSIEVVSQNEKLKDKMVKEFHNCLAPMEIGLERACTEYVEAVRRQKQREEQEDTKDEEQSNVEQNKHVTNENGKRPLPN